MKHLIDFERLLGYWLRKINYSEVSCDVQYSWGDESELVEWIKSKDDKTKHNGNFITVSGNSPELGKKYPLIWLETPQEGINAEGHINFNDVKLIIATNTTEYWLNNIRWNEEFPKLKQIADLTINGLQKGSLRIKENNGYLDFKYRYVPKYAVSEVGDNNSKSKALDFWDAIVLTLNLRANHSCKDINLTCKN